MFKVNNKNTQWRRSGVFIGNFEYISHLFLVFLLFLVLEQVNGSWVNYVKKQNTTSKHYVTNKLVCVN